MGVARSPRAVFPRGDESKVGSNGGSGEAPARCVIAVATARQPVRGPDSVVSSCKVVGGVAAALRRRVLHSGVLLGAVRSASFGSLSTQGCVCRFRRLYGRNVGGCRGERGGTQILINSSRIPNHRSLHKVGCVSLPNPAVDLFLKESKKQINGVILFLNSRERRKSFIFLLWHRQRS